MLKRNYLREAVLVLILLLPFFPRVVAVQEQTASPVAGVVVSLENRSDGLKSSAESDSEGKFSLSGLKPGTYKLRMSCNDCRYEGKAQGSGDYDDEKYLFYVTVEGTKEPKFKKTVRLEKMLSGVEYTVKILDGGNREVSGKITGAWDKSKKIKPPTIKPPTE